MSRYSLYAGEPGDVIIGANLDSLTAAVLAHTETALGRTVRVLSGADLGGLAAVWRPEDGWVVNDADLAADLKRTEGLLTRLLDLVDG